MRSSEVETGRLKAFAMVVSKSEWEARAGPARRRRREGQGSEGSEGSEANKGSENARMRDQQDRRNTSKASVRAARKQPVEADGEEAQGP